MKSHTNRVREQINDYLNSGLSVNWGSSGPVDKDTAVVFLSARSSESQYEVVCCSNVPQTVYDQMKEELLYGDANRLT